MKANVGLEAGDGQSLSPFESRTSTQIALALIAVAVSALLLIWCAFWP